jgi:hypothetical protein
MSCVASQRLLNRYASAAFAACACHSCVCVSCNSLSNTDEWLAALALQGVSGQEGTPRTRARLLAESTWQPRATMEREALSGSLRKYGQSLNTK